MVIIRFESNEEETRGLDFLLGRFNFRSFKDGATFVPEAAVIALAREGMSFKVEGSANYEQTVSALRDAVAAPVQRRQARARKAKQAHAG